MKLFGKGGKLNIIDLILILVLVCALVFAGMKLFSDAPETLGSENTVSAPNLRYTVLCEDLDPTVAQNICDALSGEAVDIGGNLVEMTRIYNNGKLVDAQVTDFRAQSTDDGRADLYITVEASAVISVGAYSVGSQEIRIGKSHTLKTLDVEIIGLVYSLEKLS